MKPKTIDDILNEILEPNADDETPDGAVRNYRTLVLHDTGFQYRLDRAKAQIQQLLEECAPERPVRVDDTEDDFGSFCATCGLSTDTDMNTGKCYCDHFNQAIDQYKSNIRSKLG